MLVSTCERCDETTRSSGGSDYDWIDLPWKDHRILLCPDCLDELRRWMKC